ncbi:hypothetical protein [Aquibacillus sediminis]|nr:hypothetical protein [Aquibacillus sediminis]
MKIEREFIGKQEFMLLLLNQLDKEIEKVLSAAYNNKQVDIVATNGGRQ